MYVCLGVRHDMQIFFFLWLRDGLKSGNPHDLFFFLSFSCRVFCARSSAPGDRFPICGAISSYRLVSLYFYAGSRLHPYPGPILCNRLAASEDGHEA